MDRQSSTSPALNVCQQIAKLGNQLPLHVTESGEIILSGELNPNGLPANALLRSWGCKGVHIQRLLDLELQLVSGRKTSNATTLGTLLASLA